VAFCFQQENYMMHFMISASEEKQGGFKKERLTTKLMWNEFGEDGVDLGKVPGRQT